LSETEEEQEESSSESDIEETADLTEDPTIVTASMVYGDSSGGSSTPLNPGFKSVISVVVIFGVSQLVL